MGGGGGGGEKKWTDQRRGAWAVRLVLILPIKSGQRGRGRAGFRGDNVTSQQLVRRSHGLHQRIEISSCRAGDRDTPWVGKIWNRDCCCGCNIMTVADVPAVANSRLWQLTDDKMLPNLP